MLDYIKCETKEDCGAIVHIVTWTLDKTMPNGFTQKIYNNSFYGPVEAMSDAADRLGVKIINVTYGFSGFSNAQIEALS